MGPGPVAPNIPAMMISQADGAALKTAIASGPTSLHMSRQQDPLRDGSLDSMIVAHEWGHYLHFRLTAGGTTMMGAESEGWADFIALHTSLREGDDLDGTYGAAIYAPVVFGDAGQDFSTITDHFRAVIASVRAATGISLDIEPLQEAQPSPEPVFDFLTLLNALRMLQDEQAAAGSSPRSLITQVLQRLEHEARQGTGQIEAATFQDLLRVIQSTDAQCLGSLRLELPGIAQHLSRFRVEGLTMLESGTDFDAAMHTIEHLQDIAKQTNATPVVTFLTGLQNFCSLVVQRRLDIAAHKIQAVETRIFAVAEMVEEWIADGEKELDVMSRLAPAV